MLFRQETLLGIVRGEITVAYRRWLKPRVRAGTKLRTAVGLVEVTSLDAVAEVDPRDTGEDPGSLESRLAAGSGQLYRVGVRFAGADPRIALRDECPPTGEIEALVARLARMDTSAAAPWTRATLDLIAARPAVRAPDLAAQLGRETLPFKRDVRRLKELGLTESLETGYRLSPRGQAVLAALSRNSP